MTSHHNTPADENRSFDLELDQGLSNRLTLLVGPDPDESSQALNDWLERREYDALYVRCPTSEEQLSCSRRLIEAFANAGMIEEDAEEHDEGCQGRLVRLINHLAGLRHDLVVVLLDYEPSERTDRVLSFLLEHLPHQIHLYLASNDIPGLNCIPRLRVRRQFQMIDTTAQ